MALDELSEVIDFNKIREQLNIRLTTLDQEGVYPDGTSKSLCELGLEMIDLIQKENFEKDCLDFIADWTINNGGKYSGYYRPALFLSFRESMIRKQGINTSVVRYVEPLSNYLEGLGVQIGMI